MEMSQAAANWHQSVSAWVYTALTLVLVIVVFRQLAGLRRQVRSAVLQGIWTSWIQIDQWFVEHHDLRPFFYEVKHDLDERTPKSVRSRIPAACEMLLDCYAHIFSQRNALEPHDFARLGSYMRKTYADAPVFKRFTDSAESWYDPAFIQYLRGDAPGGNGCGAEEEEDPSVSADRPAAGLAHVRRTA